MNRRKKNAQYKADSRQRKRDSGLIPLEVWVPDNPEAKEMIRKQAEQLIKQAGIVIGGAS